MKKAKLKAGDEIMKQSDLLCAAGWQCRSHRASPSLKSPQAAAAPSPFPTLPILIPHSSTALNSPLETHITRHANLLNSQTYLPLSYASLSIYISYVQWVLLQFFEKIAFQKSPDFSLGLQ